MRFGRRGRVASTGHAEDDSRLAAYLADHHLADAARWAHFVYARDERTARLAAAAAAHGGWVVDRIARARDRAGWVAVVVCPGDAVTVDRIRETRAYFEQLAADLPDAQYDGWEIS